MDYFRNVFLLIGAAFLIAGCNPHKKLEKYSEIKALFGTQIRIEVCTEHKKIKELPARLEKVWKSLEIMSQGVGTGMDESVKLLHQNGIKNFMVDAVGNMYADGVNCQGNNWRIGLKDPRDQIKIFDVVLLSNQAVATTVGQNLIKTVTVIAPTNKEALALAKSISTLNVEEGAKIIESKGEKYAGLIIYSDSEGKQVRIKSKNYSEYQIKY